MDAAKHGGARYLYGGEARQASFLFADALPFLILPPLLLMMMMMLLDLRALVHLHSLLPFL